MNSHRDRHLTLLIKYVLRICTVIFIQHEFVSCSKICSKVFKFFKYIMGGGAWVSVVVEALRYKSEGPGIDSER